MNWIEDLQEIDYLFDDFHLLLLLIRNFLGLKSDF